MEFDVKQVNGEVSVRLTIRCGDAGKYTYHFNHNMGHPSTAGLVAETVYNQFCEHIKKIREAAYKEGWEDKKKRRTKRIDFDWCPDIIKMS